MKKKPHLNNVPDLVTYHLDKFKVLKTGLCTDNNNIYEEPELPPPMKNNNTGFCVVCEETIEAGAKTMKKLYDHQRRHKIVECSKCNVMVKCMSLRLHLKTCVPVDDVQQLRWGDNGNVKTYSRRYVINNNVREATDNPDDIPAGDETDATMHELQGSEI